MTRSTRCRKRSIPSRSRTSSPCSAIWASTWSRPRRPARRERNSARSLRRRRRANGARSSRCTAPRLAKVEKPEPSERTDDPVRMYLREMGSVELLSREGEIAIAKRIEASREAMIAGLCESPLSFQAIIIWRDELNAGKVFLRDIIDLEATYAGPDAKARPAPAIGPDGQPIVPVPGAPVAGAPLAQTPAPPSATASATPFKPMSERANGEEGEGAETPPDEGDLDDD